MVTEHDAARRGHGVLFESACALSMLPGRGGLGRAVAQLARLSASDVVVDVGCGPGTAARRAVREGARAVIGVDPSPQMLRLARGISSVRHMERITFLRGSAEDLPLDTASATVLWAVQSVHHWLDRRRGLDEALRVLEPGGRLILVERSVPPDARGHAAHGLSEQEAEALVTLASAAGFVDVASRATRAGRRTLVAVTATRPS